MIVAASLLSLLPVPLLLPLLFLLLVPLFIVVVAVAGSRLRMLMLLFLIVVVVVGEGCHAATRSHWLSRWDVFFHWLSQWDGRVTAAPRVPLPPTATAFLLYFLLFQLFPHPLFVGITTRFILL